MNKTPVQTSEQTAASGPVPSAIGHLPSTLYERTKITRGDLTIFKRSAAPNSAYYIRIQSQGKRHMRKLLRTAEESFKKARQSVKQISFLNRIHQMQFLGNLMAVCLALPCLAVSARAETYDARVHGPQILTPLPGPTPAINGPEVYGVRPGSPV